MTRVLHARHPMLLVKSSGASIGISIGFGWSVLFGRGAGFRAAAGLRCLPEPCNAFACLGRERLAPMMLELGVEIGVFASLHDRLARVHP